MADIDALYKRAEEAFQKRSYDYARDLFLQILVLDLDHANARKALKGTLIRKFQEAGATSKIRLMAMKGQFEIQLKTTKDANKKIELCQNYLKDDPTNSKVRGVLAEALYTLGHNNAAAAEAEMAFADDTGNLAAAKVMVAAYKNTGKVKEAQSILERLQSQVKEDRDLEKLQRDLAAMQTMNAGFTDTGSGKDGFRKVIKDSSKAEDLERDHRLIQSDAELAAAIEKLEAELAESPTDARIAKRIGDLFFDKKKDYVKARDWYKKASQLAPQDSVLRDKMDDCSIRLYDLQVDAATKANDPKLSELKGTRLKFQIQSFERRVQDRPTDMGLRLDLGKAYYKAGPSFMDKAIGEFQQSVKDPKKKADSHLYLGLSFQRKKMFDMADKQYALAEEGVLSQERRLDILYNRANCLKESGKIPEAIELGKKIMETDISFKDVSHLVEEWQKIPGGK